MFDFKIQGEADSEGCPALCQKKISCKVKNNVRHIHLALIECEDFLN